MLRIGQALERAKQRGKHLLEPGKGELCVRLHACGARQLTPRRPFGQVLKQRGLADSRLSAENEDSAPPRPSAVQQPVQRLLLVATPDQSHLLTRTRSRNFDWIGYARLSAARLFHRCSLMKQALVPAPFWHAAGTGHALRSE